MSHKSVRRRVPGRPAVFAAVFLGFGSVAGAQDLPADIHGAVTARAYAVGESLWAGEGLAAPDAAARVGEPANRAIQAVGVDRLAGLRIGMGPQDVLAQAGEPLARGGNRRWDYLARDARGLFVVPVWFNNEGRLWMGSARSAPSAEARAVLAAVPVAAAVMAPLTLNASRLFDFGSATLRPGQGELDAFAQRFGAAPAGQVVSIRGYTDALGSDAYNLDLSRRRAQAVRDYLVARGINGDAIVAEGRGSAEPVADCGGVTPRAALIACLAPNRRVVIETRSGR